MPRTASTSVLVERLDKGSVGDGREVPPRRGRPAGRHDAHERIYRRRAPWSGRSRETGPRRQRRRHLLERLGESSCSAVLNRRRPAPSRPGPAGAPASQGVDAAVLFHRTRLVPSRTKNTRARVEAPRPVKRRDGRDCFQLCFRAKRFRPKIPAGTRPRPSRSGVAGSGTGVRSRRRSAEARHQGRWLVVSAGRDRSRHEDRPSANAYVVDGAAQHVRRRRPGPCWCWSGRKLIRTTRPSARVAIEAFDRLVEDADNRTQSQTRCSCTGGRA